MRIVDALRHRRPCFSFEFFAPKTDDGTASLLETVRSLRILNPAFVSVTYGAGGSSRTRTIDIAKRIKRELDIEVLAHLTCVGSSREQLRHILDDLHAGGIENIMALRGDPPKGETSFRASEGGFAYASDLVAMLAAEFPFCIGAAAYPEKHPEAVDLDADVAALARKVDAGAHFLVTQFFFENDAYFAFVERARAAGIEVPILPGIMPIGSYGQIARMLALNGGKLPQRLLAELEARVDRPEAVEDLGLAYCTLQCADLLARGAPGIHFYTLNKSPATHAVVSALIASGAARAPAVL